MSGRIDSDLHPVMILAGGTGGHIFPGLAVAHALRARGVPVLWLGADGGMETRLVPQHGIAIDTIAVQRPARQGPRDAARRAVRLLRCGARRARRSLRSAQPRAVISFGGFAAGPGRPRGAAAGVAADRARAEPRAGHDQPRAGAVRAARADRFPADVRGRREEVVGNPVRAEIAAFAAAGAALRRRKARCACWCSAAARARARSTRAVPKALARAARHMRSKCATSAARSCATTPSAPTPSAGVAAVGRALHRRHGRGLCLGRPRGLPRRRADARRAVRGRRRQRAGAVPAGGRRPPDPQRRIPGRARRRACCCRRTTQLADAPARRAAARLPAIRRAPAAMAEAARALAKPDAAERVADIVLEQSQCRKPHEPAASDRRLQHTGDLAPGRSRACISSASAASA